MNRGSIPYLVLKHSIGAAAFLLIIAGMIALIAYLIPPLQLQLPIVTMLTAVAVLGLAVGCMHGLGVYYGANPAQGGQQLVLWSAGLLSGVAVIVFMIFYASPKPVVITERGILTSLLGGLVFGALLVLMAYRRKAQEIRNASPEKKGPTPTAE